jgi:cytochrome b561
MSQTTSSSRAGADRAPSRMPPEARYGAGAIGLHWIMAALIVFVGGLGLLFEQIPRESRLFWINIHAVFGLCILILVVARMIWRRTHVPPDLPGEIGEFTRRTSHAAHLLLYVLMFVIPLVGIVAFVWHARVLNLGFVQFAFPIASDRNVFEPAENLHELLAYILFGLVGIHLLAALWHHFIRRDGVLRRMLPGGPG